MNFTNIMHIAFYTDQMDEMIDFYVNKLGGKVKASVKYEVYLNRDDRPVMQAIAKKTPDKLFNVYIELAPMQFIELFPAEENQKPHTEFNEHIGYSHYAFIVEDIYDTRKILERNGVVFILIYQKDHLKHIKCGLMIQMETNSKLCNTQKIQFKL